MKGKKQPWEENRSTGYSSTILLLLTLVVAIGISLVLPQATLSAPSGNVLSFDGKDDFGYADLTKGDPISEGLALGKAFTIEAWIKPKAFDAKRESHAAILRACDVAPPKKGDIEASQNVAVLFLDLEKNRENTTWGLKVCGSDCTDVTAPAGALESDDASGEPVWQHVAATYDNGRVILYHQGFLVFDDEFALPFGTTTENILTFVIGRWVASAYLYMDELVVWNRALLAGEIKKSWQCGIDTESEGLVAYYRFNSTVGAQDIVDSSSNDYHGTVGPSPEADRADPIYVENDYEGILLEDPDLDGIDTLCGEDNCPYVANPDQEDRDGDGVGTVCDNCPYDYNPDQLDDIDGGDGVGNACDSDDFIETVTEVVGTTAQIQFVYSDPEIKHCFVIPDCFNTALECKEKGAVDLLPILDRIPPPVGMEIRDGVPGGSIACASWQVDPNPDNGGRYVWYYEQTISCDLMDQYHPKTIESVDEIVCTAVYGNSFEDPDYVPGPGGGCAPDECIDNIWIGKLEANTTPLEVKDILVIDLAFSEIPINLSSNGVVPAKIYGSDKLDVRTIKSTFTLKGNVTNETGYCIPKIGYDEMNGDAYEDLQLHFDMSCIKSVLTPADTEAIIAGNTTDGVLLYGRDGVRVF